MNPALSVRRLDQIVALTQAGCVIFWPSVFPGIASDWAGRGWEWIAVKHEGTSGGGGYVLYTGCADGFTGMYISCNSSDSTLNEYGLLYVSDTLIMLLK